MSGSSKNNLGFFFAAGVIQDYSFTAISFQLQNNLQSESAE